MGHVAITTSAALERSIMSQRLVPHPSPTTHRYRVGDVAAYFAAPMWALQSVIWVAAPKVQAESAPFRITSPLLFMLVWSSIAGAVALSAASAASIPQKVNAPRSRASRGATVLANSSLTMAAIATTCIILAPLPSAQEAAVAAMTNLLNGATVLLAASLTLCAFLCWTLEGVSSATTARSTSLAAGTIALIVAIVASGTHSVVGLYFAVTVAGLNGVAWFVWARIPRATGEL